MDVQQKPEATWRSDCGRVTLYHGDSIKLLPALDLQGALVTDPPYGIRITRGTGNIYKGETKVDTHWDDAPPPEAFIRYLHEHFTEAIIWGGNYFGGLPRTRCVLVWDKLLGKGMNFADLEMAWTSLDENARIFRMSPVNMDGGKQHPTQKPLDLMMWCVAKVDSKIIIDPYMGSGSTGVAAVNLGREFVGIEREWNYYNIALHRIKLALAQGTLF